MYLVSLDTISFFIAVCFQFDLNTQVESSAAKVQLIYDKRFMTFRHKTPTVPPAWNVLFFIISCTFFQMQVPAAAVLEKPSLTSRNRSHTSTHF